MEWLGLNPVAGLWGLLLGSFLSATILPGGSELLLLTYLGVHPGELGWALTVCTLGNTMGGLSTWWAGTLIPPGQVQQRIPHLSFVQRWGGPILLFSWLPVVGDAFCLAAGWLRLPWLSCTLFMTFGKFARYYLVSLGA